jgi:hypothetical protein
MDEFERKLKNWRKNMDINGRMETVYEEKGWSKQKTKVEFGLIDEKK